MRAVVRRTVHENHVSLHVRLCQGLQRPARTQNQRRSLAVGPLCPHEDGLRAQRCDTGQRLEVQVACVAHPPDVMFPLALAESFTHSDCCPYEGLLIIATLPVLIRLPCGGLVSEAVRQHIEDPIVFLCALLVQAIQQRLPAAQPAAGNDDGSGNARRDATHQKRRACCAEQDVVVAPVLPTPQRRTWCKHTVPN